MIKYIHYLKRHLPDILISDSIDESKRGYTLGLEVECTCFNEVLKCMLVMHGVPLNIQNNIVTNENLFGFKFEFRRCMEVIDKFENEDYTIREFNGDHVISFTKAVLPAAPTNQRRTHYVE